MRMGKPILRHILILYEEILGERAKLLLGRESPPGATGNMHSRKGRGGRGKRASAGSKGSSD